jgi:hypothetical protein
MFGALVRVVEAPISLSLGLIRRGAELAGRAAGWALNELARELAPDGPGSSAPPATAEPPVAPVTPPAPPAKPPPPEVSLAPTSVDAGAAPPAPETAPEPASPTAEPAPEPVSPTSEAAPEPHSALNNPVGEPDLTEWPDPYEQRDDPRDPGEEMVFGGDAGHTPPGATSTSEPHPSQDPEAVPWEGPKRDKVDR